jgi:hypothetical protein
MNTDSGHIGTTPEELAAALQGGAVHVMGFADERAGSLRELMETAAGLDATERSLFCARVNADDHTGCLWPIIKLSALPARFVQSPLANLSDLQRCLGAVFDFNAELCKCPTLVIDLRDAVCNAKLIAGEAQRLHAERAGSSLVRQLVIL